MDSSSLSHYTKTKSIRPTLAATIINWYKFKANNSLFNLMISIYTFLCNISILQYSMYNYNFNLNLCTIFFCGYTFKIMTLVSLLRLIIHILFTTISVYLARKKMLFSKYLKPCIRNVLIKDPHVIPIYIHISKPKQYLSLKHIIITLN